MSVEQTQENGQVPSVGSGDWFGWFHRRDPGHDDHVIALCDGHKYLTARGGWKSGAGDLAPLDAPHGCCVCMGTVTLKRMKGAPLLPNAEMSHGCALIACSTFNL